MARRNAASARRTRRRAATPVVAGPVLVLLLVLLGACAADANAVAGRGAHDAGFWLGLWQGFIAPIAFLVSLFNDSVGIYEVRNSGGWYDFGFLIGVSVFFSSGARAGARPRASLRSRTGESPDAR